jgi:hypothetical protein
MPRESEISIESGSRIKQEVAQKTFRFVLVGTQQYPCKAISTVRSRTYAMEIQQDHCAELRK